MREILLLEDDWYRVDWLMDHVPEDVHVIHTSSVEQFAERLAGCTPSLIILDHDLGLNAPGGDGYNAIQHLSANLACPVLVWSANVVAAPRMLSAIRDRGLQAVQGAFVPDPDYATAITHLLTPATM